MRIFRQNAKLQEAIQKLQDRIFLLEQHKAVREREVDALLEAFERQVNDFRLDYHRLYEKVRVNLARLADRADRDSEQDNGPDLSHYRKMLAERKLRGQ